MSEPNLWFNKALLRVATYLLPNDKSIGCKSSTPELGFDGEGNIRK